MNDHSELLSRSLGVLYPFILIIGIYITLNGHISPGGGFQGGAVIAAVFISKHLILPIHDTRLQNIQRIEKIALVFILLFPIVHIYPPVKIHDILCNTAFKMSLVPGPPVVDSHHCTTCVVEVDGKASIYMGLNPTSF